MAAITAQYHGQDSGHVTFNVFKNGNFYRRFVYHKTEFTSIPQIEVEDALLLLMQEAVKSSGATTLAQARTAIEAKTWNI